MNMKTSPGDISNKEILKELKKLSASDSDIRTELKKLNETVDRIEVSQNDLVEIVNDSFTLVDGRLDRLEARVGSLDGKVGSLDGKVGTLEGRVRNVENRMVTKDYLDTKLANLQSDIVVYTKKEIAKALG